MSENEEMRVVIAEKLILLWGGLFLVVSKTTIDYDCFAFR